MNYILKAFKYDFSQAIIGSFAFSLFIYLDYFSLNSYFINTISAIIAFYILIHSNKKTLFYYGFMVGILWFYWISLSYRFNDMHYLIIFIIIAIALIYALIFYLCAFLDFRLRFLYIFALEYIHPFGFNYLNAKLLLTNSYISTDNYSFIALLLFITFFKYIKNRKIIYIEIAFTILYALSIVFQTNINNDIDLNIKLIHTNIPQNKIHNFWDIKQNVAQNYKYINQAIKNKKDVIVFPESSFAFALNQNEIQIKKLKNLSKKISIIIGSSYIDKTSKYNSTYVFSNGDVKINHKYILTPFGEEVPLPSLLKDIINNIFFDGSGDFDKANNYSDYKIKNYTFRNAICFESTRDEIYKNNPKYLIALSNNAWFYPSIQATLQNIYLKYMSKKYNTVIFHSTNQGINLIYPKKLRGLHN